MQQFNPLVTIIIPVYNGSNFLYNAIESALNQTYNNIEVLVINDGSNDENKSEKISKSFGSKIRYFSKENGGVSSALNMGIKNMKGEYFSWLSHDDLYEKDKIEKQIEFIKKKPQIKIVSSNFKSIHLIKEEEAPHQFIMKGAKKIKSGRDVLKNWIFFSTMIIHKDCFEKVGLFDIENKTCQDLSMQLKLVKFFPIYHLDDVLVTHRFHSMQTSVTKIKQHIKERNIFHKELYKKYDYRFFGKNRFDAYLFLGDYAMKNDLIKSASFYYKKCIGQKFFSPKLFLLLLIKKPFFKFISK